MFCSRSTSPVLDSSLSLKHGKTNLSLRLWRYWSERQCRAAIIAILSLRRPHSMRKSDFLRNGFLCARTHGGAVKVSSRCDPDAPLNGLCGKKGDGASNRGNSRVRTCKWGEKDFLSTSLLRWFCRLLWSGCEVSALSLCYVGVSEVKKKCNSTEKTLPSSTTIIVQCCSLSSITCL